MERGRPTKYRDEFVQMMIDYFSIEPYEIIIGQDKDGTAKKNVFPNKFPSLERFAASIGVHYDTLHEWQKAEDKDGNLLHPEFSEAFKRAKTLQAANLMEGGMAGAYAPAFAIFTAKNVCGWKDKTETEISGSALAINIDLGDKE